MKYLKNIIVALLILILIFVIFMFIVSSSYKNIFYNSEDNSAIILKKNDSGTDFKFIKNDDTIEGKATVENYSIVLKNDNWSATCLYSSKNKTLKVTGDIGDNSYTNAKYKQISSIFEYFKAIF